MAISQITSNSIAAGAVSASDLADGSVTSAKIADTAVTNTKIDTVAATKLTGTIAAARLPAGSILQVVSYQANDIFVSSSSGIVDTGFQASITPSSSSSKVLAMFTMHICGGGNGHYQAGIKRNGTIIATGQSTTYNNSGLGGVYATNSDTIPTQALNFLDSPATTSPVTYSVYFDMDPNNGSTVALNRAVNNADTSFSSIVLMEIAA